ncbi:hypothetical protein JTB14_021755 [Gonioctena quinquepunctata]|nr:hypothetical protein JTB14_021755 [Gonioctena quinquepunctata]
MSLERQVRAKLASKRDLNQDKEAQVWIETILGAKFPPGSVPKINTSGGQFKMMENINNFQAAIKAYGVADIDVFQTVDLWEKKDIAQDPNHPKKTRENSQKKHSEPEKASSVSKPAKTKVPLKQDRTWALAVKSSLENERWSLDEFL